MLNWSTRRAGKRRCLVCGRAGLTRYARLASYTSWLCPVCGCVTNLRDRGTTGPPSDEPDREFSQLTWTGKPYRDSLEEFVAYYDPLLSRLESWASPGRLLDLGCGPGFFLEAARRRGWGALGVDPSPFAAPYVKERFGLEVIQAPLEEANLPEASLDTVSLVHSLEHLPDPAGTLSVVGRVLRPGGVMFVETPSLECDAARMARLRGPEWPTLNPAEHTCVFSPAGLALLLRKTGFRLLELTAPVHAPLPHGNMLRAWAERPGPPYATRAEARKRIARLSSEEMPCGSESDLQAGVTRGEVAMLLAAALGLGGEVGPEVTLFPDVPREHAAWQAIHLLREEKIVGGLHDGTFRPEQFLLRAQLEQLVVRAEEWRARRS